MLIDQVKIYVAGGSGGDGCQSLFRDIYHRRGVPDGDSKEKGGDVIIQADPNLLTLLDLRYNQHHRAKSGKNGSSNNKFGRTGEDLIVRVPPGTVIKDAETNFIIRDLAKSGEKVIVAKGGAGGKGNTKSSSATPGAQGETRTLFLELKMVADVGIIGLPNAGKSTLVSAISKAKSKVAPYPFTTKSPKLGVVEHDDDTFIAADMPGLIEGAHKGRGLGDRFLKHIERTNVLVHLVDMDPVDGTDPTENYSKLEKELIEYGKGVAEKHRIVAANKMDLPGAAENLKKFKKKVKGKIWPISAERGDGLKELVSEMHRRVKDDREKDTKDDSKDWDASSY